MRIEERRVPQAREPMSDSIGVPRQNGGVEERIHEAARDRPARMESERPRSDEGDDREKANLYHGLCLLAESLRRVEQELEEVESEMQAGPQYFYQRRRLRPLRRWIRAVAAPTQ